MPLLGHTWTGNHKTLAVPKTFPEITESQAPFASQEHFIPPRNHCGVDGALTLWSSGFRNICDYVFCAIRVQSQVWSSLSPATSRGVHDKKSPRKERIVRLRTRRRAKGRSVQAMAARQRSSRLSGLWGGSCESLSPSHFSVRRRPRGAVTGLLGEHIQKQSKCPKFVQSFRLIAEP